jgi:glycosyltransferase involved in cell wall biosynthesis
LLPSRIPVFDLHYTATEPPAAQRRLTRILEDIRPTVLHTHLVHASLIGRAAAKEAGVPATVTTQHNAWHPKDQSPLYRAERATWKISDGFVALSHSIGSYLRQGGYQGPIAVCPTGVDASEGAPAPEEGVVRRPYLLSVGHMRDRHKGHDILLRAFSRVRIEHPALNLYIVGDGAMRRDLQSLAEGLGLGESAIFLGERTDAQSLMAGAKAFVLPSRWEGFGRVIIEAMNAGVPVIATDVEGIPEIICDGTTGLLVSSENHKRLAHAIMQMIGEPGLGDRIGAAGQKMVRQRFTISRMITCELSFYSRILPQTDDRCPT